MTQNFIVNILKSKSFKELIKYGIVGGIGLAVDLGVFYFLAIALSIEYPFSEFIGGQLSVVGMSIEASTINVNISHIISSILAITNNFILNSYFTFKVTDKKFKRFCSFAGIAAIGLCISTLLLTVLVQYLSLNYMPAKIISTLFVAMLQFLINKFFTFKTKPESNN